MKKQLQKQLPFELKNDIFRFLPIKKSILLITISSNIYLVNKKNLLKKFGKRFLNYPNLFIFFNLE